jgi:hypothetical protein
VFVDQLHRNLKITRGTLSSILGMQIEQLQDGIFVCQRVYTKKVLERFKMHDANPVATLCDRCSGRTEESVGSHVAKREVLGCLMYLMTGTRPGIAFTESRAARGMDRPTEAEWIDVKCVLKYLRGTSNYGLLYGSGNSSVGSVKRCQLCR